MYNSLLYPTLPPSWLGFALLLFSSRVVNAYKVVGDSLEGMLMLLTSYGDDASKVSGDSEGNSGSSTRRASGKSPFY